MSHIPPPWIQELADAAALQMIPVDPLAPVGCHFCLAEGVWEITLFVSGTEVVGGSLDGRVQCSRFNLDVQAVCGIFTRVTDVSWQAHSLGDGDELGPHVAIEGIYDEHSVRLRILSFSPRRFPAGRRAEVYGPAWEDLW
ncbi:MAG: hypothetical protein JSS02_16150 [Planctomycetes bacterium]|nr:hypothetical protein [Planctomycetota bacterium]